MVGESVPKIDVGGFDGVDGSRAPDEFAAWMDHQRAGSGDRLFAALDVGGDDAVLDIGCGTGVDLHAVAGLTARATGIDLSETMARTARDRDDAGRCTFAVADGQHLPFPAGSFDAVCLRAVLVHTPRPELTIAELSRVLRPGGRAVLAEPDHGSHVVATSEQDVLDRLLHHRRGRFRQPLIGRSLVGLASDAGLAVTGCQVFPIVHRSLSSALASGGPFGAAVEAAVADGAISAAEADRFTGSLDVLDREGGFFFAAMSVRITVQA